MVGYSLQNKESLSAVHICPHCLLLLRDPVQLIDCGHRLCQSCINEQEGDMITCSECQEKIPRNKLIVDRGFKNDMHTLVIVCSLCSWNGILKNYQNHLDQIHPNPICNYCEEKFSSVNDLNQHKQYNCQKITVDCPLQQFGCEKLILRIDLSKHYVSEQHQKVLMNVVRHLKSILQNAIYNYSDPIHIRENTINQLEEVYETVNLLSGGAEVLNKDLQRLRVESTCYQSKLDPLTKDISTLKISIQEQNTFLDSMKMNQEILQQDLVSIEQKIKDMNTSSYDGVLIWKVINVQEKMADAQSEKQTSIYSPSFYSSPTGYKMCARLYFNGDGNARGTHMSLFFVLMCGEYDAILKFPFNYKVTFCLYDQTNQQRHIIDSFRPDIKSNSFQRPHSAMNVASGIPTFVSLSLIQHDNNAYVRDNTMFIKVMVEFNDMPKTLLPYALSLNPGLTISMQQTMIQQEIQRRQQQQYLPTSSMANIERNQSDTMNSQQTNTILNIPIMTDDEPANSTNDTINCMTN